MADHDHSPCERLVQVEGGISELVRWQAVQNGALLEQAKSTTALKDSVTELRLDSIKLRILAEQAAANTRWAMRLMVATILTTLASVVARYVGVL